MILRKHTSLLKSVDKIRNLTSVRSLTSTDNLKSVLGKKIIDHQKRVHRLRSEHGSKVIDRITVDRLFGGLRGVKFLATETSHLDPEDGIYYRGLPILECCKRLPRAPNGSQPLPEGVFYLLLTGDLPTQEQVAEISKFWAENSSLPAHVIKMINNFPSNLHPMVQFSSSIIACSTESVFAKAYANGVQKSTYWEHTFEDAMRLTARLPTIAAMIYNNLYRNSSSIKSIDLNKDLSANFITMLGFENEEFIELMRLYLTIHADHEGGNVSAHAAHLVNSTLANPYLAFASGMNGLAGPLHGLACQMVLEFISQVHNKFGTYEIEDSKLKEFILEHLRSGNLIPGYGHAVLRKTDPRYLAQREFALKHSPDFPMFKLVSQLYSIVPDILLKTGKVKNPYPNVDAHSGVLLQFYGMKEADFYTVLVGVSRSLGVLSSLVWDRASGKRLNNPDSLSTDELFKMFSFR